MYNLLQTVRYTICFRVMKIDDSASRSCILLRVEAVVTKWYFSKPFGCRNFYSTKACDCEDLC